MFEPTIGLEVHAELRTHTKMFCNSKNDPNEKKPNVNICPVCMAHPGVLPTINKEAVKQVLRVGLAMNGELADYSEFDRKNYFYPDIPKAFQLSQYEFPLVSGGILHGVELTRIHLEEDTARSSHTNESDHSLVDFNRAGVPLMELVTEPVLHNAKDSVAFARELQLLLRTLEASDANMEKGEMRVEANISVSKVKGQLGTKVEVKNLNSFRAVERAIDFEIKRQIEIIEKGENIIQETRGWDENKAVTFSQRVKEEAADYRYFPEPDLPKLKLSELPELSVDNLQETLPELPQAKRERLQKAYGLQVEDVEAYVADIRLCEFFERVVVELSQSNSEDQAKHAKLASNYITNNLVALRGENNEHVTENIGPNEFSELVLLALQGDISSNGAVELIGHLAKPHEQSKTIKELAEEAGLLQQNDDEALNEIIEALVSQNEEVVKEYKEGKEQALQYLVGQGMKLSKGSANPAKLKELIKAKLA
ncbi:Asp-tRNA(Asn)/Glu-tRNA(Gln) amidotransferase subunit GatB [Candidatus Kaiserbacteria bacterium]|nr:MAG: Asp-tRNA(Asn)/Glu-tRNA(Gln) amidotransferase subunit GatB [Candidatus Kaiserbacteria bacterium]